MNNYSAYLLSDESKNLLLQRFIPKYPKIIAHHITVEHGIPNDSAPPETASLKVVGYADSGDGIEALVVSVDGTYDRPDGNIYHITWSLDPTKYSPKDSNILLSRNNGNRHQFKLVKSIDILVTPVIL